MLESDEAARRLGIKVATLYAYVSRGLIESHQVAGSRRRLFDTQDVERLSRRGRGSPAPTSRIATVTTAISQLSDRELRYRGRSVGALVGASAFEEVAEYLWDAGPQDWEPRPLSPPSNLGLSVGPKIDYVLIKTFNPYTHEPANVILAKALLSKYFKPEGENTHLSAYSPESKLIPWNILLEFKGSELEELRY